LQVKGSTSLDEFLKEFDGDAEVQAAFTESRRQLAETLYADEPQSFSALRLKVGLSQAALAQRVGTTQSYIARVEKGTLDPSTEKVVQLAEALGVAESTAFAAIRYQISSRGQNK